MQQSHWIQYYLLNLSFYAFYILFIIVPAVYSLMELLNDHVNTALIGNWLIGYIRADILK